jgi:hypothetical protein
LLKLIFWHTPAVSSMPPEVLVVERRGEQLAVQLTIPPAGFLIYEATPGLDRLGASRWATNAARGGIIEA